MDIYVGARASGRWGLAGCPRMMWHPFCLSGILFLGCTTVVCSSAHFWCASLRLAVNLVSSAEATCPIEALTASRLNAGCTGPPTYSLPTDRLALRLWCAPWVRLEVSFKGARRQPHSAGGCAWIVDIRQDLPAWCGCVTQCGHADCITSATGQLGQQP